MAAPDCDLTRLVRDIVEVAEHNDAMSDNKPGPIAGWGRELLGLLEGAFLDRQFKRVEGGFDESTPVLVVPLKKDPYES